jgi:GWxTD domain-containing protein
VQLSRTLTGWAAVGALALAQQPETVQLDVVRFYRGSGALTAVDGFCRVPISALTPLPAGGGAAYRFALAVRDSAGLALTSQSWGQTVPAAMLGVTGASLAERFAFAARAGHYTVEVAITDSASGRVSRQRVELTAYGSAPQASDLLLATGMREVRGAADSVTRPGEIRKGDLLIEASGRPVLTPQQSSLGYYLELYPTQPETASVVLRVRTDSGRQVVATAPQPLSLAAGGGAARGVLDLGGLPPGGYWLDAVIATPAGQVVRSAAFGMAGFETAAAIAAAPSTAPSAAPADRFATLAEPQLDSMYEPLVYLMDAEEQGMFPGLTVEGKRRFLREFWAKRGATPGSPRNEEEARFYAAIAEANRRFRERGTATIPGWRTDRGRIFIRYGAPDEVLSRPQAGSSAPYEVWKYTRVRARKFVFYDVTRFGNYALIWTDERREPSRPNWRDLLGPEAVEDVQRF